MNWIQYCHGKRYKVDAEVAVDAGGAAAAPTLTSSTEASKRTSPRSSGNPTPSPRGGGGEHSKPKLCKMEAKTADEAGDGTASVIVSNSDSIKLIRFKFHFFFCRHVNRHLFHCCSDWDC